MVRMVELNPRQRTVKEAGVATIRLITALPVAEDPRNIFQELVVEAILWGAQLVEYDGLRPELRSRPLGPSVRSGFPWLWSYRLWWFLGRWERSEPLRRRLDPNTAETLTHLADHLLFLTNFGETPSEEPSRWNSIAQELETLGARAAVGAAVAWYATIFSKTPLAKRPAELLEEWDPFVAPSVWEDFHVWNRSADHVLAERFDLQIFGRFPEHPTV